MEYSKIFSLTYRNGFGNEEVYVLAGSMTSAVSVFARSWYDAYNDKQLPEILSIKLFSSLVLA